MKLPIYIEHPSISGERAFQDVLSRDGSGSGLDADLLDGFHATEFARKVDNRQMWFPVFIGISDRNTAIPTGTNYHPLSVNHIDPLVGWDSATNRLTGVNLNNEIARTTWFSDYALPSGVSIGYAASHPVSGSGVPWFFQSMRNINNMNGLQVINNSGAIISGANAGVQIRFMIELLRPVASMF